jgi:hypothetical protein
VIVIKPKTVEQLLFDALANDVTLLPFLVFAFYAGVRPDGELQKLLWSDIDLTLKRPESFRLGTRLRSRSGSPIAIAGRKHG